MIPQPYGDLHEDRHVWSDDQAASISLAGFLLFLVLSTAWIGIAADGGLFEIERFGARSGEVMFGSSIVSLLSFGGSVYLIGTRRHALRWQAAGVRRTSAQWMIVATLIGLFFVPVSVSLSLAFERSATGREVDLSPPREVFDTVPIDEFLLVFVGVAVIVPIAEELFFRGMLYRWLRTRLNLGFALVISSAIFGAVHFSPISFISLSAVGALCALMFEYSRSIWPAVAVHAANNGIIVIVSYFVFKTPLIL